MSKDKEPKKKESDETDLKGELASDEPDYCFVIMPISDHKDYEPGHFRRVYDYIIKPACEAAGFVPIRADEVNGTNMIVIDILQKIINSKMAVCDLSSRNPNVLYELGIRQSFDLPVTLIKDDATERIFDIQGFRDVFYKKTLRYDEVLEAIVSLTASIKETYRKKGKEVNSIVELMGISKASVKDPIKVSAETELLLNAIDDIGRRVTRLEPTSALATQMKTTSVAATRPINSSFIKVNVPIDFKVDLIDATYAAIGEEITSKRFGVGTLLNLFKNNDGTQFLQIRFKDGTRIIRQDSEDISGSNDLPF